MKHERIDSRARVWMVTRGPDGRPQQELDPKFLRLLDGPEAQELEAAVKEIAETRLW